MALIVAAFIVCLTGLRQTLPASAATGSIFISIAQALNMPPLGFAVIIGLEASCCL